MNCFSEEQLSRISHLVREIEKLSDVEKLFLYLQLPCGRADASSSDVGGIQKSLDLFSKKPDQETTQTYTWILSHLEIDPNVSLPKQEVYDEYRAFCQANRFEPLCVADFGKAMKHAFPCIKPRRLGQRGNSRYCYSGLRKKYKIQAPSLPDIGANDEQLMYCTLTNCDQANSLASMANTGITGNGDSTNNNCNGNNMTMKPTSSAAGECSLSNKQSQYNNRHEVMNLKIGPCVLQQHVNPSPLGAGCGPGVVQCSDDPSRINYSFQLQDIAGGQVAISRPHKHHQHHHNLNNNRNSSSSNNNHHHNHNHNHNHQQQQQQQQQQLPTLSNHQHPIQQQHSTSNSSASSFEGSHGLGHRVTHHSRYNDYCSRTIQQPGTPDDDDYRHNYQDMLPLSGHFLGSTTTQLALQPAPPAQVIALASGPAAGSSSGASFAGYHQQAFGPLAAAGSCAGSDEPSSPMVQASDAKHYLAGALQSQPPFGAGTGSSPVPSGSAGVQPQVRPAPAAPPSQTPVAVSNNIHLINHQMNVTHMDACASPFQSPASTPYPSMSGGYPIQDMMQEYCSSGCRLYQSS